VATPSESGSDAAVLPFRQYADPARADEEARLIARHWQYACPAEKVTRPGTYFATRCAGVPVVVVRDREGVLRAHVNVCRHRGTVVMRGEGDCRRLQCPYHAWTYGLDGSLRAAPRSDREADFDASALSLLPAEVSMWGPLVFVAVSPDPPPIFEELTELGRSLADLGLDISTLRFHGRTEFQTAANWKIVLENYLECYHCAVAHPGFAAVMDTSPDRYRLTEAGGLLSHQTSVRETASKTGYPLGTIGSGAYHLLVPNHTFDVNPGEANLAVSVTLPDGPGRSHGFTDRFFGPEVTEEFIKEMVAFDDEVGAQDQDLVEWVQAGVSSGAVEAGHLLLDSERLVAAFQRYVAESLESFLPQG
jgi:phenylpropionate dioxygenase-like ring-hydroxylating dioxygenase large terminal subunit